MQAHLSPGARQAGTAPYDGLAITWFDDVAAMRAGAATEAYARTRADEANFLAGELPFVITIEQTTFPRTLLRPAAPAAGGRGRSRRGVGHARDNGGTRRAPAPRR